MEKVKPLVKKTTFSDVASEQYDDDFDVTYKSESQKSQIDSSAGKASASLKLKSGKLDDLDEDLLLQEARQLKDKIRGKKKPEQTPIKEEDGEDELEEGSRSKYGSVVRIEEANNNYDDDFDSKAHSIEYVDDDFEQESHNSEADFAKVSISQSGRLPPLSAANPVLGIVKSQTSLNDASRLSYKQMPTAKDLQKSQIDESGDKIDFEISETKSCMVNLQHQSPKDPGQLSMDSMDFGLSESNFPRTRQS
jgi:hypothetical protein